MASQTSGKRKGRISGQITRPYTFMHTQLCKQLISTLKSCSTTVLPVWKLLFFQYLIFSFPLDHIKYRNSWAIIYFLRFQILKIKSHLTSMFRIWIRIHFDPWSGYVSAMKISVSWCLKLTLLKTDNFIFTLKGHSVSDPGFFPDPDQNFFLSPDPDRPKIRIRSGKIRIRIREKNVLKLELK